jgi:hypothetical protein
LWCVIVTTVTLLLPPPAAHAQLRSFRAISYLTLAPPPPGLEQLHQDLAQYFRQRKMLVEAPETFDERLVRDEAFDKYQAASVDPRSRCGRCRLLTDLPQPRVIGLECSDYTGKYVGVFRVINAQEMQSWVRRHFVGFPAARPLNTMLLASGQSSSHPVSAKDIEFLKQLLREVTCRAIFGPVEA